MRPHVGDRVTVAPGTFRAETEWSDLEGKTGQVVLTIPHLGVCGVRFPENDIYDVVQLPHDVLLEATQ
jgi:hypothetical protein